VLVNLITNAIDAMADSERRELTIQVDATGSAAFITVTDTGGGLTADAESRLFEPFFTTKPAGSGLGLGLPISADIIKAFGGSLKGRSIGSGAAFTIELIQAETTHQHA
jgi:C4-dicarboxylate-specific signal transduction histidine kinase